MFQDGRERTKNVYGNNADVIKWDYASHARRSFNSEMIIFILE
jgi:hypothetical protein